jgi:hypothetical protein
MNKGGTEITGHIRMSEVVEFRAGNRAQQADDTWLRRLAMQIALQLPEGEREALQVLDLSGELVRTFLRQKPS